MRRPKSKPIDSQVIRGSRRVALLLALAVIAPPALAKVPDAPCTYYASPTGKGDGKWAETPFRVAAFWRLATPGSILCLEDGVYRGADSMISPPRSLSGRTDHPIIVRALGEGRVLIDGEGSRRPVVLSYNDWFIVDGINACCSSESVVEILHSNYNVIRRVAAWDAADGNNMVFGVHYGEHNLLEDVAGWGIARKIFSSSQEGNFTTIRRAWARWEGSHVIGPKMTYELSYNNHALTLENSIGTWSGEKMAKSYVLLDYHGKPWIGRGEGTYQNYEVNQPHAIFALTGEKNPRARLLGSIAYIAAGASFPAQHLVLVTKVDSAVEIADTLAYVEPGSYSQVRPFGLYGLTGSTGSSGAVSLSAGNITSLGGAGAVIGKDWQTRNVLEGASPAIYGPNESAFSTTRGANLCHRYVDGMLTSQPLWPWAMNQRIIDAMIQSDRRPVDVTATIEGLLGKIPAECSQPPREQAVTPALPPARPPDQRLPRR